MRRALSINFAIHSLGLISVCTYLAITLLSPHLLVALSNFRAERTIAKFADQHLVPLVPDLLSGLSRTFADPDAAWLAYTAPLFVVTACFCILVFILTRYGNHIQASTSRLIFVYSLAFSVAAAPAAPMLFQDFWLSAAWGKMVAEGRNPYHANMQPADRDHFPLEYEEYSKDDRMTYGPTWALMSGAIMWVTSGCQSPLAAGIGFKVLLLGLWIGSLAAVNLLMNKRSPQEHCLALVIFGWLPLNLTYVIVEGHNDIAMVLFILLWLVTIFGSQADTTFSSVLLAIASLSKYVSGPLVVLDAIHHIRGRGLSLGRYIIRIGTAGLVGLVGMAIFFRSPEFFHATAHMTKWKFLTPASAAGSILDSFNLPRQPALWLVQAFFPGLVLFQLWKYWRQPTPEILGRAGIAIMSAIAFVATGHTWPWFLTWVIALLILAQDWWYSRWILGVALVFPLATSLRTFGVPWLGDSVAPIYFLAIVWAIASGYFSRFRIPRAA